MFNPIDNNQLSSRPTNTSYRLANAYTKRTPYMQQFADRADSHLSDRKPTQFVLHHSDGARLIGR